MIEIKARKDLQTQWCLQKRSLQRGVIMQQTMQKRTTVNHGIIYLFHMTR
ncbi:hypothetical protein [Legionella steelei]|nr:hypothetical protein [Legionella steelei]